MSWFVAAAWAVSVEVPSDDYPTVVDACHDANVDEILVASDAEKGGSVCSVSRDLTIQGEDGVEIPAVYLDSAHLELHDVTLKATPDYRAVRLYDGTALLEGVTLLDGSGGTQGALYAYDSELEANGLTVRGFTGDQAIELFSWSEPSRMVFASCDFSENTGGLLYAQATSGLPLELEFSGCEVYDNFADSYGTATSQGQVSWTIEGGTWQRNTAMLGGAVHVGEGALWRWATCSSTTTRPTPVAPSTPGTHRSRSTRARSSPRTRRWVPARST